MTGRTAKRVEEQSGETEASWPRQRRAILDWLARDTRDERFIDNILVELCERLQGEGVPVARATIHFRTLHPQWLGARLLWRRGMEEAKIDTFDYGVEETGQYLNSPVNEIYAGAEHVRKRLIGSRAEDLTYKLYQELREEGFTDYVAFPMDFTLDKRHIVSFATDAASGFTEAALETLADVVPLLTLVSEIRLKNILARTLLETYVGRHASGEILAGATRRGSGRTVSAAIMVADLRDFTELTGRWPRDDVIGMLNEYFDAICEPVEQKGGEILKFMGDGLLAIFPLAEPGAPGRLLAAAREGYKNMAALNRRNQERGLPQLRHGIGIHLGDVAYGNIGSRRRLDFTVIGPAVNIAARLEAVTKEIGQPILMSADFAAPIDCECAVTSIGTFPLRGVDDPVQVFAMQRHELDEAADPAADEDLPAAS